MERLDEGFYWVRDRRSGAVTVAEVERARETNSWNVIQIIGDDRWYDDGDLLERFDILSKIEKPKC